MSTALNYENVVETGSETEEDDKLPVSEEDPLINGTGSPASLTNPDASPHAESHGLLTKDEEDDEMRDSGVEHIWPDNDMLSASVDGTGECLQHLHGRQKFRDLTWWGIKHLPLFQGQYQMCRVQVSRQSKTFGSLADTRASCHSPGGLVA